MPSDDNSTASQDSMLVHVNTLASCSIGFKDTGPPTVLAGAHTTLPIVGWPAPQKQGTSS